MFSSDNTFYKVNSVHGCSENLSLLDFYVKLKKKDPYVEETLCIRPSDFQEILPRVPYNGVLISP